MRFHRDFCLLDAGVKGVEDAVEPVVVCGVFGNRIEVDVGRN
jgi:hypothetical protein